MESDLELRLKQRLANKNPLAAGALSGALCGLVLWARFAWWPGISERFGLLILFATTSMCAGIMYWMRHRPLITRGSALMGFFNGQHALIRGVLSDASPVAIAIDVIVGATIGFLSFYYLFPVLETRLGKRARA